MYDMKALYQAKSVADAVELRIRIPKTASGAPQP